MGEGPWGQRGRVIGGVKAGKDVGDWGGIGALGGEVEDAVCYS